MKRVLVIEDEAVLRSSVVRGLNRVTGLHVVGVGTLGDALSSIDEEMPDLILSDLDLPDRSGVELIGELGRRGMSVPVVFVSAFVRAYSPQIPRHADVHVLEKPVPLDHLRQVVRERLQISTRATPFGAADYVQLACMGRHSVHIELARQEGVIGEIDVVAGVVWSARDQGGVGPEAFGRLVFATKVDVTCETLDAEAGERNLFEEWEALLLDAARHLDECTNSGEMPAVGLSEFPDFGPDEAPVAAPETSVVPAPDVRDEFDYLVDEGMDAMLGREYGRARAMLERAAILRPDSSTVLANLARLSELYPGDDVPNEER